MGLSFSVLKPASVKPAEIQPVALIRHVVKVTQVETVNKPKNTDDFGF